MTDSAFWGASIEIGEDHPLTLPEGIVLTLHNVALTNAKDNTRVRLTVEIEEDDDESPESGPLTVCTLIGGKTEQYSCNVTFFPGDAVKISAVGTKGAEGKIDLVGTLDSVGDLDEDEYSFGEDEEEEEEEEEVPQLQQKKQKQEVPKALPQAAKDDKKKKNKKKNKKQ